MTATKKQMDKHSTESRYRDDDDNDTVSSSPAQSEVGAVKLNSKSRSKEKQNGKAKSNAIPPKPETTDTNNAPLGVRRLVFATAVRTVTETTHPFPSYLRQLFQDKAAQRVHRLPWMTEFNRDYVDLVEVTEKNPIRLFNCSTITTSLFNENHDACLIDLYFYERFIKSRGVENQRWSPEKHLAAWNRFVEKFSQCPEDWLCRLRKNEEIFFKNNGKAAVMIKIHCNCANMKLPCAVVEEYQCPMCYAQAQKLCLSKLQMSATYEERLLELTTLLDRIMEVDVSHLSVQISDIHNNNRKRDRRIAFLEQAIQSSTKLLDSSSLPSPLQKHKIVP